MTWVVTNLLRISPAVFPPPPTIVFDPLWIAARRPRRGVPNPVAPDLAIEIQSPDQSLKELTDKVPDYLANGVRLVWIIQINKKIAAVFRPGQPEPKTIQPDGILNGDDVIPGFRLPVAYLFE